MNYPENAGGKSTEIRYYGEGKEREISFLSLRVFTQPVHRVCLTSPVSTAHTAICAREVKASFDKMVLTCVSTVL